MPGRGTRYITATHHEGSPGPETDGKGYKKVNCGAETSELEMLLLLRLHGPLPPILGAASCHDTAWDWATLTEVTRSSGEGN